jgi:hypothetical protein
MKLNYFPFDVEECTVGDVFNIKICILTHNFLTVQDNTKLPEKNIRRKMQLELLPIVFCHCINFF